MQDTFAHARTRPKATAGPSARATLGYLHVYNCFNSKLFNQYLLQIERFIKMRKLLFILDQYRETFKLLKIRHEYVLLQSKW